MQIRCFCICYKGFQDCFAGAKRLIDTAQLAFFIPGVMPNLDVVEESVQLMAMNDTTTGKNIFIALQRILTDTKLDLSKLISVTTNGVPAMDGQGKGVVSLLESRGGHFRKLRTTVSICGFANLISYRKYLR